MISIETKALRFALAFAAKRNAYYSLDGVLIEPAPFGALRIVGTDGQRMGVAISRDSIDGDTLDAPVIVGRDQVDQALKAAGRKTTSIGLAVDGAAVTLGNSVGKCIDATYPPWKRVIPKLPTSGESAKFDPYHLTEAEKAFAAYAGTTLKNKGDSMELHQNGYSGAVVTDASAGDNAIAVLMPRRGKPAGTLSMYPDWMSD